MREILEEAQGEILFLTPFSLDLNPIEIFWAQMKMRIIESIQCFDTFHEFVFHKEKSIIVKNLEGNVE